MEMSKFSWETGINIVCLIISAAAPTLAIGWAVGLPTGAAISFGLAATIRAQQNKSGAVRGQYRVGAWIIRVFAGCFEQMAYLDAFAMREKLPFDFSPVWWAWIATVFMAALDLWALSATSAKVQAETESAENAESLARADRMDRERAEKKEAEEKAKREQVIELAKIAAETERLRAFAENESKAVAAKADAEARKEVARSKAEANQKRAEVEQKQAELEAETKRREAEARQKQAEAQQKQAEAERKESEARRSREEAERIEKGRVEREKREQERREREEKEAAASQAELRQKLQAWQNASTEARTAKIEAAKTQIEDSGKVPTQALIGAIVGVSEKSINTHVNHYIKHQQQPVEA